MNQKKTESNFFRAFDEIYKIKKIKGITFNLNHKSVYCFLLNYQMMSGKVFPSYKHIQDNLGIGSDNTVKKYLDELEEMGLVKATSRKGTSKIYELVTLSDFNALDTVEQQTRKQPNKNLHIKTVEQKTKGWGYGSGDEAEIAVTETTSTKNAKGYSNSPSYGQPVKQDYLPDPFLDDCGVSHDSMFEEYSKPQPTKQTNYQEYGRKCSQCYQNPNGEWDCKDSWCSNNIPF
ncbi:helix-turn-helix domain-containing protein [Aeromonas sp. SCS5]|uniref:helix-turn-helix domain-containing protein n=1 Tax=Aeromonas sp. SCS5 TaxID=1519205 RepID=UPI0009043E11|nr:helix-turn-helix domain-containing protein [Aeromonas sp. SCS5]